MHKIERTTLRCRTCGKRVRMSTSKWEGASKLFHFVRHTGCKLLGSRQLVEENANVHPK